MEPSPVLDTLAGRQVEDGTPLAADAAEYLGRFGSATMKPVVWEQLSRWHQKYVESGAELRLASPTHSQDDWLLYSLDSRLLQAYERAQGWTLSPEDVSSLAKLIGDKKTEELACTFRCGSSLSVGPAPGNYTIYGRVTDRVYVPENRVDYLMSAEPFQYSVNQYQCGNLQALEQKLLQFPAGSTFSFAHTGSGLDRGDWITISAFLRSHGYSVRN